eukprot:tig00000093_g3556.t1
MASTSASPPSPSPLAGRVALITGASSGIGAACARKLAQLGCKLVLLARREDRLRAVQQELEEAHGAAVHVVAADVRDKERMLALPAALPEAFRDVEVLVLNAGLALGLGPSYALDPADFEVMLATNVLAPAIGIRAFVPGMLQRGRGHVIAISSIAGKGGAGGAYAGGATYCSTKAALDAYVHSLRHELVATPLRVTLVSPGLARTEFALVRFKGDQERAENWYKDVDCLTPEDIADAVAYAASCPPNVQVSDLQVMPTCQAGVSNLHRGPYNPPPAPS